MWMKRKSGVRREGKIVRRKGVLREITSASAAVSSNLVSLKVIPTLSIVISQCSTNSFS